MTALKGAGNQKKRKDTQGYRYRKREGRLHLNWGSAKKADGGGSVCRGTKKYAECADCH